MDIVKLLSSIRLDERRKSAGSHAGRAGKRGDYKTLGDSKPVPEKGRVKIYKTIKDALKQKGPGHMFSTKGSRRVYVISKRTHGGKDKESVVNGKIAKGFTKGSATPSADWGSVKSHASRTSEKYGTKHSKQTSKEGRYEKDKGKK